MIKLSTGAVGFGMVMTSIFMNETPGPKPSYPRDGSKNAALWKTVFWMGIALMLISMHIGVSLGPDDTGLSTPEELQTADSNNIRTSDFFEDASP